MGMSTWNTLFLVKLTNFHQLEKNKPQYKHNQKIKLHDPWFPPRQRRNSKNLGHLLFESPISLTISCLVLNPTSLRWKISLCDPQLSQPTNASPVCLNTCPIHTRTNLIYIQFNQPTRLPQHPSLFLLLEQLKLPFEEELLLSSPTIFPANKQKAKKRNRILFSNN